MHSGGLKWEFSSFPTLILNYNTKSKPSGIQVFVKIYSFSLIGKPKAEAETAAVTSVAVVAKSRRVALWAMELSSCRNSLNF